MGEKFLRFKRRAQMLRLVRSMLSALAAGLFVSGLLLLLARLEVIGLHPLASVGIGLGSALAVGCAVYFLFRVTDAGLAKMLDGELSLNERLETMLEYMGEDSAILKLQREDADAALEGASLASLRLKRPWAFVAAVLIGALMLTSSFVFSKTPEPPPVVEDEEFAITANEQKALLDLISEVASSEMDSPYRENTVEILQGLYDVLCVTYTVREKDAAVLLAMNGILREADASSYAVELINALWLTEQDTLRALAKALNYYEWPRIDEWKKFHSELTTFRDTLVYNEAAEAASEGDKDPVIAVTEQLLLRSSTEIVKVLGASGATDADPLYSALYRLAIAAEENGDGTRFYGLSRLSEMLSESGYDATQREIDATVTALESLLYSALSENLANTGTGERAIERLAAIFDCDAVQFERPSFPDKSGGGDLVTDEDVKPGGAIGGGTEYGSDDLVLDPYTNTYVEYGTILDRYYALMLGSVENGDHTEAERKALEKYFTILYGGFEKEEGEENDE